MWKKKETTEVQMLHFETKTKTCLGKHNLAEMGFQKIPLPDCSFSVLPHRILNIQGSETKASEANREILINVEPLSTCRLEKTFKIPYIPPCSGTAPLAW